MLHDISTSPVHLESGELTREKHLTTNLALVRYLRVEVRHEGDAPSDPIIILDDVPSDTITPDVDTPLQTPEQPEKRPRPGYGGMAARRSRRAKKVSSKHQRGSHQSSQEIDSTSNDLDQNATAQGPSSPEGVPPAACTHPVLKGMGAIMKPPLDLTAYFDLVKRDKAKLEIRKEQAGLEV
ncbi:hypothetical protein BKA61DRAFT_582335 [Leptodontidium sp. MPI-SDFR-AT-0119]|nr:hypothetical protein BKA61DRAFT_582335 [Leptodontidium sp. MPI-SDFR-AT-0119]